MLKGFDIVIVSLQSWDICIGSNCKNIALELAKNNRVLYVNYPLDRITRWRHRQDEKVRKRIDIIQGKTPDLEKIQENLWNLYPRVILESINWLPEGAIYDAANYRNCQLFAQTIQAAANKLGFARFILFNDNLIERGLYLNELLLPLHTIYYLRDNLITLPFHRKHGKKAQERLMSKVDVVTSNSDYLTEFARKYNPHSYMVGQGCDLSLFQKTAMQPVLENAALAGIPYPRLGYIGVLTALRLDIQLLIFIAQSRPDWHLVLIGPEDEAFKQSKLHQFTNVHFLGNQPAEALPGFLHGFDVALNPQLINELTAGNYPRKIDEYLIMGKPTVSTKTKFMSYFQDQVYLAEKPEQTVQLIAQALLEDNEHLRTARKALAATHTWENSVKAIGFSLAKATNKYQ